MNCPQCHEQLDEEASRSEEFNGCLKCGAVINLDTAVLATGGHEGMLDFQPNHYADLKHLGHEITYKDRVIMQMESWIESFCSLLNLKGLRERAIGISKRAIETQQFKYSKRPKYLAMACIYLAARQDSRALAFSRFQEVDTTVDPYLVGATFKKLQLILKVNTMPFSQNKFIDSLVSKVIASTETKLGYMLPKKMRNSCLNSKLKGLVIRIDKVLSEGSFYTGKNASSTIAAVIVVSLQTIHNLVLSVEEMKCLFEYLGVGRNAYTIYLELKKNIIDKVGTVMGEDKVNKNNFFHFSELFCSLTASSIISHPQPKSFVASMEKAKDTMFKTNVALLRLKQLKRSYNDSSIPESCPDNELMDPEVLVRERALLHKIDPELVATLSAKDLNQKIRDIQFQLSSN